MDGTYHLPSPAFTTRPPVVRNAGLISAATLAPMRLAWDVRHYHARNVTMHDMRDVFVVGEGLVFDRDLAIMPASITQHTPTEIEAAQHRLQAALAAKAVARQHGQTILCLKRGTTNYGHWLVEMLPVAFLCLGALQARKMFVLAPAPGGPLGAVPADSLDLLGVPSDQVRGSGGSPQWFERLLVPEGLTWHGHYISPLVLEALDRMGHGIPPGRASRVWVSRAGDHRALHREAGLCAALAGLGWAIVQPSRMRLRDQVALFKGARHVAGVAGAGLANLVFAPPPARVTGFVPAAMQDTFFWLLSELRGHDYTDVRCPAVGPATGPMPWDAALTMPVPEILSHLA